MAPVTEALVRRSFAPLLACACALALLCPGQAAAAGDRHATPKTGAAQLESATLEQCVTSVSQVERSATFAAEMTAIPGSTHMAMRIEVQERTAGPAPFHTVVAPGLGSWRSADPKVKIYKYLKQVTNLSAPADYRALVRFRWQGPGGRVLKRAERVTPACVEPEAPASASPPSPPPAA
jgi:hypothetical protein